MAGKTKMKPKLWQVKKAIARRYQRAITRLIQGLLSELKKLDGPFSVADAIRRIARSPTFITKAYLNDPPQMVYRSI